MLNQEKSKQELALRQQAEQALRESEERYRMLAEAIPHPVWRSDAAARQIDCNRRWQEYTGQTPEEAQGDGWMKALHPDDVAWALQRVREDVPGGEIYEAEYRLHRASDDSYHWYLARAIPQRGANGTILGWFGCAMDIDDQKRAQVVLAEREARLLEAQEVTSLGFYIFDIATGRWTSSSVLDRIFGIPADYARTLDGWAGLTHPDERQEMLDYLLKQVVGEKKPFDREYRIVRYGDKQVRWVHGRGRLQCNDDGQPLSVLGTIQDITERKQAEEALQKAHHELEQRVEERTAELAKANETLDIFRKFVEASGEGFGMADLDGRIAYANRALCRLMGEDDLEAVIGKNISAYCPEEYLQRRRDEMIPALLRDENWHTETQVLRRQGKPISIQQSTSLIRDESGNPFRTAVVISDITERKQAQEALRASEERFRVAFEEAPLGIVMVVGDGVVVRVNRTFCQMSGYTDEELIGYPINDVTYPEDRDRSDELTKQALAGAIPSFALENRYLRKDGGFFWGQITVTAVHDRGGNVIFALGIIENISERKRVEEALRESEERYELAVRGAGVGIWDWDFCSGKVYYSPRWKMLFGYDENDIGDSVEDWARLLHPEERDWILKFQDDFLAGMSSTVTAEYRLRHKDGSYRWIVAHGLAVRDEQGRACRLVGSHGDITDRKRAEEALQRQHHTLKHLLQSSDHERQLIAYEIHDGLAQELAGAVMQLQVFGHLKDKKPEEAARAYDAAVTMLKQGLFESRRLIAGVRPPILDEAGVVEAIAHLVNKLRREKGPKIEFLNSVEFDRLVPTLENSVYRITQEAMTNACRHSKSKKVRVALLQQGDRLRIEIRDWGIGFDPKAVPKNHFGLEGIRQRARLLGGKCNIRSTAGKGSRVAVELPVVPRDEEA